MKILVLNCGSSSLKYKVFDNKNVIAKGGVEKILPGEADGMMCAKCMDDDLFEIAQTGKKADDDDDESSSSDSSDSDSSDSSSASSENSDSASATER